MSHSLRLHRFVNRRLVLLIASALAMLLLALCTRSVAERGPADPVARVVINVPAGRAQLWSADTLLGTWPVAVGGRRFPTPTGSYVLREITFNPWWLPPESEWAKDEKPKPPGPNNPMGRVKMRFAPLYYMHGTADTSSIGRPASHGCVRFRNRDALDLAQRLVALGAPRTDTAYIAALVRDPRRTETIPLDAPVAVEIRYDRIELSDSLVTLHPDPYGRGLPALEPVITQLIAELPDSMMVDTLQLQSLTLLRSSRPVVMQRSAVLKRR